MCLAGLQMQAEGCEGALRPDLSRAVRAPQTGTTSRGPRHGRAAVPPSGHGRWSLIPAWSLSPRHLHPNPVTFIPARSLSPRSVSSHPCHFHPSLVTFTPVSSVPSRSLSSQPRQCYPGQFHPGPGPAPLTPAPGRHRAHSRELQLPAALVGPSRLRSRPLPPQDSISQHPAGLPNPSFPGAAPRPLLGGGGGGRSAASGASWGRRRRERDRAGLREVGSMLNMWKVRELVDKA